MPRGPMHALSLTATVLAGAIWSNVAAASTITTFDFDVTPIFGSATGTGSITVDTSLVHDVTALDLDIDGLDFKFKGGDLHDASAVVKNGDLISIEAVDITKHGAIALDFLGGIFFDFAHPGKDTIFALTDVVDPPTAAPLPDTLPMMLFGLMGVGIIVLRKRSTASVSSLAT
jgi:hypothetical protein